MSSAATMTAAEYAKHRGVSDSYIRRVRRKGNLVLTPDGHIDVRASDELLDGVTNPVQGGKRGGDQPRGAVPTYTVAPTSVISVQEAVRRERLARARLAELELGEEAKQLTRVEEVNRAVFTLVRQALNRMQGQSGRLRRQLAQESDPFKVAEIIDQDVAATCKEMRKAAERLLSGADSIGTADDAVDGGEGEDESAEDEVAP